jgi:hypothetical protein
MSTLPPEGPARPYTSLELTFVENVLRLLGPDLPVQTRALVTKDGNPWLFMAARAPRGNGPLLNGVPADTLRLDYDGWSIRGGWGPPAPGPGPDGIAQALYVGVNTRPPDGLEYSSSSPAVLAGMAAAWLLDHQSRWKAAPTPPTAPAPPTAPGPVAPAKSPAGGAPAERQGRRQRLRDHITRRL